MKKVLAGCRFSINWLVTRTLRFLFAGIHGSRLGDSLVGVGGGIQVHHRNRVGLVLCKAVSVLINSTTWCYRCIMYMYGRAAVRQCTCTRTWRLTRGQHAGSDAASAGAASDWRAAAAHHDMPIAHAHACTVAYRYLSVLCGMHGKQLCFAEFGCELPAA